MHIRQTNNMIFLIEIFLSKEATVHPDSPVSCNSPVNRLSEQAPSRRRTPTPPAYPAARRPSALARQTRVAAVETTLVPSGKMRGTTGPLLPPALLPGTSPLLDSFPNGTQLCTMCPAVHEANLFDALPLSFPSRIAAVFC